MKTTDSYFPQLHDITQAKITLQDVAIHTPLQKNQGLSEKFKANVLLKREDLQIVRSYKIRGAFNKISQLSREDMEKGVICASAGNHAQGVAFSCRKLNIRGKIYMPVEFFVRKMGGIPIDRSRGANVIRQTVNFFNSMENLHLAMTPEGTRKHIVRWKAGFHTIAKLADVPVYLGSFDWGRKIISIWEKFELTDDPQADIRRMKDFYREKGIQGKFPENFTTEY